MSRATRFSEQMNPAPAKLHGHSWTPVGILKGLLMDLSHRLNELLILFLSLALPGANAFVVSATGDFESITEFRHGVVIPHRFDHRIPSSGFSLNMLAAFIRISRWRLRYSFSFLSCLISASRSSADALAEEAVAPRAQAVDVTAPRPQSEPSSKLGELFAAEGEPALSNCYGNWWGRACTTSDR